MKKLVVLFLFIANIAFAQQENLQNEMSLEEMMNIEVSTASKSDEKIQEAPGIITVISRQEIENYSARNLGDVLNRIPGFIFLSANVFADNVISIRGQSLTPYDNHILILVNGRPVRDAISGGLNQTMYTAFPLDIIDHIEVIRGPGSVLYGSCAFSGVVNIITLQNSAETLNGVKGNVSLKGGSWGAFAQNASINAKHNDFSIQAGVNHFKDKGPKFEFTDYMSVHSSANWDRDLIGTFTNIQFKNFHLNALYSSFLTYSLGGADNNWEDALAHDNNKQQAYFADAGYTFNVSEKLNFDANLTYNQHSWDQSGNVNMTASDLMFELSGKFSPAENLNIIAGLVTDRDFYYGERFINDETQTTSSYIQSDCKLFEKLKFIGGLQYNKLEGIDGNFSPRIGIISNFTANLGAKLLYSTAFRKAYPLETSFNHPVFRGNKDIKPELISTSEIQFFYNTEKIQLAVTGFYSKMSDIIIRNWITDATVLPYGGYLKYFNGGTHEFMGFEFESKTAVSNSFFVTSSFTYQENENEAGIKNASLHSNTMVKIGILYNNPKFNISVYHSYFSDPYLVSLVNGTVSTVNKEATDINLLSAKLSVDIMKLMNSQRESSLNLFIEADNLLNQDIRYPEFTSKGVNTLLPLRGGMSIYGGLNFKF